MEELLIVRTAFVFCPTAVTLLACGTFVTRLRLIFRPCPLDLAGA